MKNIRGTASHVTPKDVSAALAELMPNIMRGVQLDFFVKKGVTQTQFLMLAAIRAFGRCPMGTLASGLQVQLPTATGVIDRLVRSGHVKRCACAEDRRQVMVELTPKGEGFFQEFSTVIRRRWEEVLTALEPDELEAFHHAVTALRDRLQPR